MTTSQSPRSKGRRVPLAGRDHGLLVVQSKERDRSGEKAYCTFCRMTRRFCPSLRTTSRSKAAGDDSATVSSRETTLVQKKITSPVKVSYGRSLFSPETEERRKAPRVGDPIQEGSHGSKGARWRSIP